MSETSDSNLKEDDPSLLEVGDDEENVKLVEDDDEMLLLSSPSPVRVEESSSQEKQKCSPKEGPSTGEEPELLTSSENILVEDSDSAEDFGNSDNSVEVIDSEDESLNECEEEAEDVESSSAYLDGKIHIFYLHGSLFIWNAENVQMLREECRIIGKFSGCLPRAPRQNNQLGLPLQLMPEEARLLEEIEAACVVEEMDVNSEDEKLRRTAFEQTRLENYEIQKRLYKESRKEEIKQHMGEIVAGKKAKKRKLNELAKSDKSKKKVLETSSTVGIMNETENSKDETRSTEDVKDENDTNSKNQAENDTNSESQTEKDAGKEEDAKSESGNGKHDDGNDATKILEADVIIEEEDEEKSAKDEEQSDSSEEEIPDVDEMVTSETDVKHSLVQIFTGTPWHHDVKRCNDWIFPLSQKDRLRYAVFRDLWRKGYYLTSGSKFGGDFLVYPGDPARFHSHYIAICIDINEDMSVLDLISMARLGSNVRKTALICSFNKFRQVSYLSMQWTGMV